jgi:hypothetical protein
VDYVYICERENILNVNMSTAGTFFEHSFAA